jgi:hypothetical protein
VVQYEQVNTLRNLRSRGSHLLLGPVELSDIDTLVSSLRLGADIELHSAGKAPMYFARCIYF